MIGSEDMQATCVEDQWYTVGTCVWMTRGMHWRRGWCGFLSGAQTDEMTGEGVVGSVRCVSQRDTEAVRVGEDMSDKYLTFRLSNEEYGFVILIAGDRIRMMNMNPVLRSSGKMHGGTELLGEFIPVAELCRRFAMPLTADS